MDTQNDGLEEVTPLNMAILGIYGRFLECTFLAPNIGQLWHLQSF